jgi:hypothetical protein
MKNKQMKHIILLASAATFLLTACVKKDFDSPPIQEIPVGNILTMQDLRDTFTGTPIKFDADLSIYAVITMDDKSGNIYKNAYAQDPTGAIVLRTLTSGGLYEGDSVRIYLKGTTLSMYNGMLQLDSVDVDKNIIKQATQKFIAPEVVTISQINSGAYQAKLIKLNQVEFIGGDLGKTYANPITQQSQNVTLTDCDGNQVIVRTSGYASFAGNTLPNGNGSIVAIVGEFNGTKQLYIRKMSEVVMNAERCTGGGTPIVCDPIPNLQENFSTAVSNVDVDFDCWYNLAEIGSRYWRGRSGADANGMHIQSTSFNSGEQNRNWLITPPIEASGSNSISFDSQVSFWTHNALTVWISTNFDGVNTASANWVQIPATLAGSASGSNWVNTGSIPLFGYLPQGYTGSFFIGFRYDGNGNESLTTSFRLDNIVIN